MRILIFYIAIEAAPALAIVYCLANRYSGLAVGAAAEHEVRKLSTGIHR